MSVASPLRYPGGKQLLARVLRRVIVSNNLEGCSYAEPYAGGAGAALSLLFSEHVNRLLLNDADPCIYAMWRSILSKPIEFSRLVRDTPLTIDEWRKQKTIYSAPTSHSQMEVGFATFFLNRTNRSGIIKNAGPIGGHDQSGQWKIDARFNRAELIRRIEKIALYSSRISVQHLDAITFVNKVSSTPTLFVYLDPPYFRNGHKLYLNHYRDEDHTRLARFMKVQKGFKWLMSYDRAAAIERLYKPLRQVRFSLSYSATNRKTGKELLILGTGLNFPREWRWSLPATALRVE